MNETKAERQKREAKSRKHLKTSKCKCGALETKHCDKIVMMGKATTGKSAPVELLQMDKHGGLCVETDCARFTYAPA